MALNSMRQELEGTQGGATSRSREPQGQENLKVKSAGTGLPA